MKQDRRGRCGKAIVKFEGLRNHRLLFVQICCVLEFVFNYLGPRISIIKSVSGSLAYRVTASATLGKCQGPMPRLLPKNLRRLCGGAYGDSLRQSIILRYVVHRNSSETLASMR